MTARERRAERVRQDILGAAAGIIARQGFHGMTMRDLARATNRSIANAYNYFASKEQVLFALQSRAFETLLATAGAALSKGETPAERLYLFIRNHVAYVVSHPDAMRVLVHEAAALEPPQRDAIRQLKDRYFRLARDLVAALLPAGAATAEVERTTYSVFGMLNWLYGWYDASRHGTATDVARTIYRMTRRGLSDADEIDVAAMEARAAEHERPSLIRLSGGSTS